MLTFKKKQTILSIDFVTVQSILIKYKMKIIIFLVSYIKVNDTTLKISLNLLI